MSNIKQTKTNNFIYASIGLVLVAAIVIISVLLVEKPQQNSTVDNQSTVSSESAEVAESSDYIKYTATTEGSALDQLQKINSTVEITESEYGKLVDSINGLKGGTDGKYWSFYVDGKMAEVGADTYQLKGGELIEWKFQSF